MSKKILFIIIDQLRADCLNGALANSVDIPNLRALMNEGVTFNRHYSVTVPCGPSRASLFTGLYAMNHRSIRNGTPLAAHHTTMATEIRKAGFDPLLFGYTDSSIDPTNLHPNDPALRTYEGLAPGFTEIIRMRYDENSSWLADLIFKGYQLPDSHNDVFRPVCDDGTQTGTIAQDYNKPVSITNPALYSKEDSDTRHF